MTGKRYVRLFTFLSRCIFTVLTAEAAWLAALTLEMNRGTAPVLPDFFRIPQMAETLAAGVLLYTVMAAAAALALREYDT